MRLATVATCNLNQWSLDFTGNLQRIRTSIRLARSQKATYRLGPELETTGYGCADHFLERDTVEHSWQVIAELISSGDTDGILVDLGAPVEHRGVVYNCRVLLLDRKVLLIRPKTDLAEGGNFFESRYFAAWPRERSVERFLLPGVVAEVCKDGECWFGNGVVEFMDGVTVGCETCEELWMPRTMHVELALQGVDVIGNGSGSHHVLRKLKRRVELIESGTRRCGGVYLYANQQGCDGDRLYYDGCALIGVNGTVVAQAEQFSLKSEVEVVSAVVDIDRVRDFRNSVPGRRKQMAEGGEMFRVRVEGGFSICGDGDGFCESVGVEVRYCSVEEEIARGPACWLWDYLRRSGLNGFFLALSGGADSSASATIVGSMCQMLVEAVKEGGEERERLLADIRRVTGMGEEYVPEEARELAGRLLFTMYMGCGSASSGETRERAGRVAKEIGAWHVSVEIDGVVEGLLKIVEGVLGKRPRFGVWGGEGRENLALQCLQARVRMVVAYLFAQCLLWGMGRGGGLLVLGSANVDEGLRGYLTKYDCSSADINPIGGISKTDLKRFLKWAATDEGLGYAGLMDVVKARPTAELEPRVEGKVQTDEEDMGMTYSELSWFGRLRKLERCGPVTMFRKLVCAWGGDVAEVARKVKFFWRVYSMNRHKMTVLTPAYFAEDYAPDDNRFDMRPFLYRVAWPWQFGKIDEEVKKRNANAKR